MKKRWMKSLIETSKQDLPAMPFHRATRHATRVAPKRKVLKIA